MQEKYLRLAHKTTFTKHRCMFNTYQRGALFFSQRASVHEVGMAHTVHDKSRLGAVSDPAPTNIHADLFLALPTNHP